MTSRQIIDLNELPQWSPWPARILGVEEFIPRTKTASEIIREYDKDKWGVLLKEYESGVAPQKAKEYFRYLNSRGKRGAVWQDNCLRIVEPDESAEMLLANVRRALSPYLPAPAVVELGAGYGRIIITLALEGFLAGARPMAGEYTPSGLSLLNKLATSSNIQLESGLCDFTTNPIAHFDIPSDSLIFTVAAITCVPQIHDAFIENLSAYRPKAVVHIEPIYEHCNSGSLLELLQRRYIEINDYNRNLLTILRQAESVGKIEILEEQPRVFGSNPLLVMSIVAWRPR